MIDLHRFFEVPFDETGLGLDRLIAFTTDHLQRLISNNPGALFNGRINATTTALNAVEACTTDDMSKLGLRKARVQVKDTFREVLPEQVAKIFAAVAARYGMSAPEVAECFPFGRKIFSDCRDDKVENHLQALINGLTPHTADLGPQPLADAGGLLSTWLAVYAASESSTGAKTSTQEGKRNARLNLQLELFKNVLTLGLNFARQPEKLSLYMRQDLLETHPRLTGEEEAPAAAV